LEEAPVPSDHKTSEHKNSDNEAIVRRLYSEAWNKRKLDVVSQIISPSHGLQAPTLSGSSVGPEAYKSQISVFLAAFPDLRFTIEDTVVDKDNVVARWTFTGTHKGKFMGVSATNAKVSVDGMTLHHLAGGKIIDSFTNWDALGMLRQLGALPAGAEAKTLVAR
jgi:steroid delta-isomerase-like uncharacterized protein